MPQYLPVFELSSLDGNNGFKLNGVAAGDLAGWSASSAGDLNGDGFADLIVGAKRADPNDTNSGASYVVFGGNTLLGQLDGNADGIMELASLASFAGANGFTFNGVAHNDYSGDSVASAGDVNGDGFDDLIIGTKTAGKSYVVFGGATLLGELDAHGGPADGTIALSDLTAFHGDNGFRISGASGGSKVSSAGDINHDGFADVIVGAPGANPNGNLSGAAYVVFGQAASGFSANLNVSVLDGVKGFKLNGELENDGAGVSVSSAGDVNGDGIDDLLVGAWRHPNAGDLGCTYLVFGKTTAWDPTFELSDLDGVNGYKLQGTVFGAHSGEHDALAGDVNADGFADVIISAVDALDHAGSTYVVFGGPDNLAALDAADIGGVDGEIGIHNVNGTTGFRMDGEETHDYSGTSVSSAGDFNGDGFDDVIVSATAYDGAGAAYVVFGAASGVLPASFGLGTLEGNFGFKIPGLGGTYAGHAASAAGDVNGDGFDDLIVGAYYAGTAGASYVIYGAMPGEAVTRDGTAIANTIHGGNFDDKLNGLDGGDTLIGHGGSDALNGGKGADIFVFEAASDSTGSSYDTIKKANFGADMFDVDTAVAGIDDAIDAGKLRKAHFDHDLARAADDDHLASGNAVLFTPDAGNLAGKTFLIVDLDGTAGYQAGVDLVVYLASPQNIASLGTEDFV